MKSRLAMIVSALGAVLLVALIAIGIAVRTGQLGFSPVLSGSMAPTASAGDLAVLWQVQTSSLQVGDVVSFYPPNDTTRRMHRIVTLTRAAGVTTIKTKGDANRVADPWGAATLRGAAAYRMVAVIPLLGWTAIIGRSWIYALLIFSGLLLGFAALQDLRRKPVANQLPLGAAHSEEAV